jgi:hypothetical protein
MVQRDYIMRMIEQMGMILIRLRQIILRRTVAPAQVRQELASVLQGVGFDLSLAKLADVATLEQMVAPTGELEPARGWLVAETLYLDGLESALDDRPEEAQLSFDKALRLYGLLAPDAILPSGFPEAEDRIAEIRHRLEALKN